MKKSLVISTIATVLVVVVALTTATFAWFTTTAVAKASSTFKMSSAGGTIQITPWDKTAETWAASPYVGTDNDSAMPLGAYNASYEYSVAEANGAFETTDALTSYKPLAPKEELTHAVNDVGVTGAVGLPSINFINAYAAGSNAISVANANAKPVVARFRLDTIKSGTLNGQIEVTITAGATTTSYTAAQGLRFVLIGEASTPAATSQSFTFGTAYSYVTNNEDGSSIDAPTSDGDSIVPKYNLIEFEDTEADGGSSVEKQAEFGLFGSGNATYTSTLNFKMTAGVPVDCVLYVWFDGQTVTNNSSLGEVTFQLNFKDLDA